MIDHADLIVVATALGYARPPEGPSRSPGRPESIVELRPEEILKGEHPAGPLPLHGYLSEADDFNDHPPPYTFVRPNGRRGSCFANTYKRGALFLLFLKVVDHGYTVDWDPLAPVNEQLRSREDPWLLWIKGYLAGVRGRSDPDGF